MTLMHSVHIFLPSCMQYAILYTAHMIVGRWRLSHENTVKLYIDHQKRLRAMATDAHKKMFVIVFKAKLKDERERDVLELVKKCEIEFWNVETTTTVALRLKIQLPCGVTQRRQINRMISESQIKYDGIEQHTHSPLNCTFHLKSEMKIMLYCSIFDICRQSSEKKKWN